MRTSIVMAFLMYVGIALGATPKSLYIPLPQTQYYQWQDHHHDFPLNAIIGGSYQQFICRAQDRRGTYHAGRLDRTLNRCIIISKKRIEARQPYQLLVASMIHWSRRQNDRIRSHVVVANHAFRFARIPCSTQYQNAWYPGEIIGHACGIVVNDKIVLNPKYIFLVEGPHQNSYLKTEL